MNVSQLSLNIYFTPAVPEESFLMSEPMLPKKSAAELNHMLRLKHPKQEETSIIQSASCKGEYLL